MNVAEKIGFGLKRILVFIGNMSVHHHTFIAIKARVIHRQYERIVDMRTLPRVLLGTLFLLIILAAFLCYPAIRYRYGAIDSLNIFLFRDRGLTRWAVAYTEEGMDQVLIGMHKNQVHQFLGEPLKRFHDGYTDRAWMYADHLHGKGNHHQRNVFFDEKGHVVQTVREYWVD